MAAATADDTTAQVFEWALVSIGSYRPKRAPFAVWLFAIARNVVSNYHCAQGKKTELLLAMLSLFPLLTACSSVSWPATTPQRTNTPIGCTICRMGGS